jgi:cell division protein FtsQ
MRRSAAFTGAVGGLFLLAALSGAVTGGHVPGAVTTVRDGLYAFLGAGGLTVQSVKIVGQALAPAKVLEDAIGVVPRQTSIFDAEPHAIRARLEALPWVARADVRRVWPNRIEVLIVERRPFAIWQREGQLHVIDRDGAPIAQHDPQLFANLLLVVGPGAGARAVQLVDLLDRQPGFKARVRAAVLVGQRRWNLRLDNGVEVRLPEEGAEAAISDLVQLDREQQLLARQIEAIDMRFPDRLIVKLPQGSPDAPRKPAAEGRDT